MPRMQVYLPEELYELVKTRGLRASELLQNAVRVEVRRLDLLAACDTYLTELIAEVGEPTPSERAGARKLAARIARRAARKAK